MILRVLVAEDSSVILKSVRALLRAAEIGTVLEARDGVEALALAIESKPDLLILDYAMPEMNGIDVARLIHDRRPDVPMILMTVTAAEYLIAAAFGAGIRGFVLKRDAGDDLIRAIHAVVRGGVYVSPGAALVLCERYLPAAGVT